MNTRQMRLAIAAHHEPGAPLVAREIAEHGLQYVFDAIPEAVRINPESILTKITECGAHLITPEDSSWPDALDDLQSPPIVLVVKGDAEVLKVKSLAIVGTRNPTPYGIRIASEFADSIFMRILPILLKIL